MSRRHERRWKAGPVVASVLLHGAVVGLLAFSPGEAAPPAKVKVYAVDIVSPPPNVAGAPPTEALSNQEPGPAAAPAPAAETPAAAPPPEPAAPEPDPAPPRAEAPKEPATAPEPRRTPPPRPTPPTPRPSTPATPEKNRPAPTPEKNRPSTTPPSNRPSTTTPATNRPATNRPAATPEKNRPATRPTTGSGTTGGTGTGSTRTRGDGTSTAPATGSNPQANSPGGEGITIRTSGEACPVAGYCENVTRQVRRFFRPPANSAGASGDLCFRLMRDGSVTDIGTERVRGGAAFRLQMMEAAEAAGNRRAFGTLPSAFPSGSRWCVTLTPS